MSSSDSAVQHFVDRKGRLWQERTVTIKPNSTGYGFSLSGERPVFIESIVEEGPAHKAGIKTGDRIIKVDGQTVYDKKHSEVVLLLRGAVSVSLTVITQYTHSHKGGHSESSGSQKVQELTLNALRTMLDKQQKTFEQLTLEYTRLPTEKLEQELKECEEMIKTLRSEIGIKANIAVENITSRTDASITSVLGSDKVTERRVKLARDNSILARKLLNAASDETSDASSGHVQSGSSTQTIQSSTAPYPKFKSPKMFRKSSLSKIFLNSTSTTAAFDAAVTSSRSRSSSPTKPIGSQVSVLNDSDLSDEDLEFGTPQYGPFSSLQELNNYPAHMSIFFHYLIQNRDPKYLCFYLVAQSYQNYYKGSDLKQKALEIMWTYCLPTAPLCVELDESVCQRILDTLDSEENEMKLKSVFVESRDVVAHKIAQDLTAYRHKRTLGLGSIYGEQLLTDHMTSARELEVTNSTLMKILKDLLSEKLYTVEDVNKNYALTISVCTFLMDVTKGKAKFDSSLTERNISFTRPEVNKRKIGKTKKLSKCGHNFQLMTYNRATYCDHCERLLWGITYQGYQCNICEMNVHRYGCIDDNVDSCIGKKKDRKKFNSRRISGGQQSNTSTSDLEKPDNTYQYVDGDGNPEDSIESSFNARRRSRSDPKQTLMAINIAVKEEEVVQEKKKTRIATVGRTQSLKERRSHPDGAHPISSQDTSLNTTPSWNSVASSSSISDESLNASSLSTGANITGSGISKSSTLDTVVETTSNHLRAKSPLLDDEAMKVLIDADLEEELIPWKLTSKSEVVKKLQNFEIQRQELLKELVHTERTHLKKLQIMKHIYKNPLLQQGILSPQQVEYLFPSLEELVVIHSSLCADMKERQFQYPDGVVRNMADILIQRFDGAAGEKLCHACSVFASNQVKAEKFLKEHTAKNLKLKKFLQDAESNRYCNRLTLKELLPIVWTRLTRYQLLMENISKINKKNETKLKPEDKEESDKMATALTCIKDILTHVNKHVKQSENRERLYEYQQKIDISNIERSTHSILEKYKDLNLMSEGRVLMHEGPLMWKISHRKTVEVRVLLLNDILVLLSCPEDGSDKFYLKRYFIEKPGGIREEISPIVRLKEIITRSLSSEKSGRSFLLINNSQLMTAPQMYEFSAENVLEKKRWEDLLSKAREGTIMLPDISPTIEETSGTLNSMMSNIALRDQLDKIDSGIQKLLDDKLAMLRALQGIDKEETISSSTCDVKGVVENTSAVLKTVSELTAQVSKLLVPNPTKYIVADVQYQLSELTSTLHVGVSGLLASIGESSSGILTAANNRSDVTSTTPQLDGSTLDATTVSPSDNHYILTNNESTPSATPLPNGSYYMSRTPTDDDEKNNQSSNESDDDEGPPPPLPQKPPPSNSSTSSATPPDVLDTEAPPTGLPRTISEYSVGSEDFHLENSSSVLAPPEQFNEYLVSDSILATPHTERLEDSPPTNKGGAFRRVRSNPSLTTYKVMSVISSVGGNSRNDEDTPPRDKEYIMKLQSEFTP